MILDLIAEVRRLRGWMRLIGQGRVGTYYAPQILDGTARESLREELARE